jgi:MFS family permease
MKNPQASNNEPEASAWSPLRQAVFRSIWTAAVISNTGTWMQSVGTAWLMTSLTPSPLLVALMQTATSLPVFLLGIPAGVLADLVDRRKLLLVVEAYLLLMALTMGLLTLGGFMSAWSLLLLAFLMGVGSALDAPAWQAIVPDLVERQELPAAVSLNATGFNVARAVGPAIGGLVVAAAGPAAVFLLNSVSFLFVLIAVYRWRRTPAERETPPEDMLGAAVAGMRYVRHAPALQAVFVRIGAFAIGASALWALLPAVTRHELGLGATGYGILLGSLGFGAVGSALFLPRLQKRLPVDRLTGVATLIFAGAVLALAYVHFVPLLVVCLLAGGMAWLTMMSSLSTAATTACPAWVRARALSVYLLVFFATLAVGSFGWGVLAEQFGNRTALSIAAVVLVGGLAATLRWPLQGIQQLDLSPSGHWPDPQLALTPDPDDGPVLITVEYRVPTERADEFIQAMDTMRIFRRREGAVSWGIFRDLADPERYVETFLVTTWAEHMRQHARVTVEDQATEAYAFSLLQPGVQPFASHLIAARMRGGDRQTPTQPPYTELS